MCEGVSRAEWDARPELQDASFWNICVIGEAATRISDEERAALPTIPWSAVGGARSVPIHGYDRINPDKVWQIITVAAPELVAILAPVVPGRENYE